MRASIEWHESEAFDGRWGHWDISNGRLPAAAFMLISRDRRWIDVTKISRSNRHRDRYEYALQNSFSETHQVVQSTYRSILSLLKTPCQELHEQISAFGGSFERFASNVSQFLYVLPLNGYGGLPFLFLLYLLDELAGTEPPPQLFVFDLGGLADTALLFSRSGVSSLSLETQIEVMHQLRVALCDRDFLTLCQFEGSLTKLYSRGETGDIVDWIVDAKTETDHESFGYFLLSEDDLQDLERGRFMASKDAEGDWDHREYIQSLHDEYQRDKGNRLESLYNGWDAKRRKRRS